MPHLVKCIPSYIKQSFITIARIFIIYRPFRFFAAIGAVLFGTGFLVGLRVGSETEGALGRSIDAETLSSLAFHKAS